MCGCIHQKVLKQESASQCKQEGVLQKKQAVFYLKKQTCNDPKIKFKTPTLLRTDLIQTQRSSFCDLCKSTPKLLYILRMERHVLQYWKIHHKWVKTHNHKYIWKYKVNGQCKKQEGFIQQKNKWGNHQSKISKNQSNAIWWFFCVECTKNRPSSMLETHHKTDTTMCHFCAFMLFSVSTEIMSVVNFLVEQGKRKKTKPSQWGKTIRIKVAISFCHYFQR